MRTPHPPLMLLRGIICAARFSGSVVSGGGDNKPLFLSDNQTRSRPLLNGEYFFPNRFSYLTFGAEHTPIQPKGVCIGSRSLRFSIQIL